jgi:hypothetical protein
MSELNRWPRSMLEIQNPACGICHHPTHELFSSRHLLGCDAKICNICLEGWCDGIVEPSELREYSIRERATGWHDAMKKKFNFF